MRFEEDASESIVFVVSERSPAPNVLYLSSGMPKEGRVYVYVYVYVLEAIRCTGVERERQKRRPRALGDTATSCGGPMDLLDMLDIFLRI